MMYMMDVILRILAIAAVVATALVVRDENRVGSLWRRAMFLATVAVVPRLTGFEFPLYLGDSWSLSFSALAWASLLAALLIQSARALHSGRPIQLGVGIAGAAAALLGNVSLSLY
jgi:hypothetical protein